MYIFKLKNSAIFTIIIYDIVLKIGGVFRSLAIYFSDFCYLLITYLNVHHLKLFNFTLCLTCLVK